MGKKQSRNEFRKHKPSGHPGYIFNEEGNYYDFIGITHSSDGGKNIPLEHNPEPGNDTQAYIKPQPESDQKSHFKNRLNGWKFNPEDALKVEEVKKKSSVRSKKKKRK